MKKLIFSILIFSSVPSITLANPRPTAGPVPGEAVEFIPGAIPPGAPGFVKKHMFHRGGPNNLGQCFHGPERLHFAMNKLWAGRGFPGGFLNGSHNFRAHHGKRLRNRPETPNEKAMPMHGDFKADKSMCSCE